MRISFHHANPSAGNESFLVRFDTGDDDTACVLIDAGDGVDLDALLGPDDSLAAICLTHAHLDHYADITAAHRTNTPVLTAPATAAVLTDVFDVASDEYDVAVSEGMADAVIPVEDWTSVAPGIDIHPVPAGHVPGGAGFLIRATEDTTTHHLLATGDFTMRRAGGFPGFDPTAFTDINALFLTGSTNDTFESSLTDGLGTALERAHGGARTLVTTSGLFGVHCAYLLAALVEEYDLDIPIRVVGTVAKHYAALDYDLSNVEPIPVFEDPRTCLGPGVITIAGPEIPVERSSGRLFDAIRDDPSACVVQLVGSGETPVTGGQCTIQQYECVNHPTRDTLTDVHDTLDPRETIIVHKHGGAKRAFNDLDSVVWGAGDTNEYTLYDGRHWQLPPWMGGGPLDRSSGRTLQQVAETGLLDTLTLPTLERHADPDLEAEGIDTTEIDQYLHRNADAAESPDVPDSLTDNSTTSDTSPDSTAMTTNADSPDQEPEESTPGTFSGLVETTHANLDTAVDPGMQALLEETGLTPAEFMAAYRSHHQRQAEQTQQTESEHDRNEAEANGTESQPNEEGTSAERDADQPDSPSPESTSTDQTTDDAVDSSTAEPESNQEAPTQSQDDDVETFQFTIDPLLAAVAERAVEQSSYSGAADVSSVDALATEAVIEYSLALLSGDAAGDDSEQFQLDVTASSGMEQLLSDTVADSDEFDSASGMTSEGMAAVLSDSARQTIAVQNVDSVGEHLDAIVQNDAYIFDDKDAVVETAIVWQLTTA